MRLCTPQAALAAAHRRGQRRPGGGGAWAVAAAVVVCVARLHANALWMVIKTESKPGTWPGMPVAWAYAAHQLTCAATHAQQRAKSAARRGSHNIVVELEKAQPARFRDARIWATTQRAKGHLEGTSSSAVAASSRRHQAVPCSRGSSTAAAVCRLFTRQALILAGARWQPASLPGGPGGQPNPPVALAVLCTAVWGWEQP